MQKTIDPTTDTGETSFAAEVHDIDVSLSIVVPVYRNAQSLPLLIQRLAEMNTEIDGCLEVVFIVDGSPDESFQILRDLLPSTNFRAQLVAHSRNFGSFAAIRTGMELARGPIVATMAADLQEPPELVLDFYRILSRDDADVVVGARRSRKDTGFAAMGSRLYWNLYRRIVQPDIPIGGVDMFAGNRAFIDRLLQLDELNSSLIGLVFWLGYRRETVFYDRLERETGSSGWTLRKKMRYLSDSVFSFTDLPIRLLMAAGCFGIVASILVGTTVLTARILGLIHVPGYAATVFIIAFFSALNLFGLGIIGAYVWRAFENTKRRPNAVVMANETYSGRRTS